MKSPHFSRNRTSSKPAQIASPRLGVILVSAAIAALTAILFIAIFATNSSIGTTTKLWSIVRTIAGDWPQLRWMWTTFHMAHYQPLSWLTFSLDFTIRGANPTGYHRTNLLLYTVNAVVFFFVARSLLTHAFRLADAQRNPAVDFAAALAIGGPLTLWHHHSSFHHGVSYRKDNEP